MRRLLGIIFLILISSIYQVHSEENTIPTSLDIAVAGNSESARITIWSQEELKVSAFPISDVDLPISGKTPFYLVLSAEKPLGQLSPSFETTTLRMLARIAGIRSARDFNSDLLLDLDWPLKIDRILKLDPIADETRHRTLIDLVAISTDEGEKLSRKGFAAYNAYIAERQTIHLASAILPDHNSFAQNQPKKGVSPPPATPNIKPEINRPQQNVTLEETNQPKRELTTPSNGLNQVAPIKVQKAKTFPPFTIVIDPGHGGYDPGAIKHSVVEKSLVLDAALELKALLQKNPNYIVKLTRETDKFVSLEKRVSLARGWDADLFISIHADSIDLSYLQGASVYTLSEKGLQRSKAFAIENDWDLPSDLLSISNQDSAIAGILSDFAQRDTVTKSAEFADMLIDELTPVTKLVNNSHRNAGYVVLFASDVPAVLLELGFISNKSDARRLSTVRGRRATLKATKQAIDRFFQKTLQSNEE